MGVPLWAGAITKKNSREIEAIQVNCMKLISGRAFTNYEESLQKLGLDTMAARREKLCLGFAKKCLTNPKFTHWFPVKKSIRTRSKAKFLEPKGKMKRFLTSSIPHLTRILNCNL